jgi:hypothetical protein
LPVSWKPEEEVQMKTFERALALAAATLLLGLSAMPPARAQPYGYPGYNRPPPYQAPAYPQGYQPPPQQAPAAAAEASVEILVPKEGAVVAGTEPVVLDYAVKPGPKGDHVHIYVDGQQVAIVSQLKGRYDVGRLGPGRHQLTIKVVNRDHVPIGVESSVNVTVQ